MRASIALVLVLGVACGGSSRHAGVETEAAFIPTRELSLAGRKLTTGESRLVDEHGFAILGKDPVASFHVGYTALFHAHQPVYVTADSLLHAWHSSYDAILMDLERHHLIPTLDQMLEDLRTTLATTDADPQARADVDVYLAIAQSLLHDAAVKPVANGDTAIVAAMFERGHHEGLGDVTVFGARREFDFSMLKPRGHYVLLPELEGYFRAMMWLGRVELQIASKHDRRSPWQVDRRTLRAAVLLGSLFTPATRAKWAAIDSTLEAFVGPPDSMSLPGLAAAIASVPDLGTASDAQIMTAFGVSSRQRIRTQLELEGAGSIAFLVLGQRFVHDAKVFGDLTYASLDTEPPRLMPTPLDIAHAVFHNPAARPLLQRDVATFGPKYAAALDEAARASDAPDPALWNGSLYHMWLHALRELSPDPARDGSLPAPLASDAWARRMLDAQLASWAELRHDNLLYAKESFTTELSCAYPDGYVDPYPAFYAAMEALARKGRATVSVLATPDDTALLAYFDHVAATMARLREIALRERANQPLLATDLDFLNHMVSLDGSSGGCTFTIEPRGWYADLFYDRSKIMHHEPVVADVHTQPTDEDGTHVGLVLHAGTGKPRMLVVRLQHDAGAHAQTYRGFVASYAETITKHFERLTDDAWRERIENRSDAAPAWLQSITAP